jgi:hypothetical protein
MRNEGVSMLCQRYDMLELGKIHGTVIRSLNLCFLCLGRQKSYVMCCWRLREAKLGSALSRP